MNLIVIFCIINLFICVPPILSQENGLFWWLQNNPDFGGVSDKVSEELNAGNNIVGIPQNDNSKNMKVNEEEDCVCVEYYLCGANNTVITNGEGIFDVRLGDKDPCQGTEVCCRLADVTSTPPVTTKKPLKCGERGGGFVTRIQTSDNSTQFSEFPWMLALLKSERMMDGRVEENLFQCGASLIHPQVALTAAHCVNSVKEGRVKIRAGEWNTKDTTEPVPHQERYVTKAIMHPDFYSGALYNDIALLVLDRPLEIVVNVLPVCLPKQGAEFNHRRCVATGWGKDAFAGTRGEYQKTLRKVELPVVPSDVCQDKLRTTRLGRYFRLHRSLICAGGELGKDTCNGDGGGPLACYDPAASAYVQVGIVSWGIGCGEQGIPAVYTNVPLFRKWIDDNLQELGYS